MIKVYEIKSNGHNGITKEIDPSEGVTAGWTYTAPPSDGCYRWEAGEWLPSLESVSSEPVVSIEEVSESVRAERNSRLVDTDWTQGRDISEEVAAKWAPYRQSLRDLPNQTDFPVYIEWPEQPE
jgi:hypothetical protein